MRTHFTVTGYQPQTQSFSKLIRASKSDKGHSSKDHLANALLQSNLLLHLFHLS